MRYILSSFLLFLALLLGQALATPLVVTPGGPQDIVIDQDDTVNATATVDPSAVHVQVLTAATTSASGQLNMSLVNNLDSTNVNAYVTGLDSSGVLVMLQPNGSWYYPTATDSGIPQPITANVAIPLGGQGSTTQITLPGWLSSGRVWFADGTLKFFTVEGGDGPSLVEPSAVNPSDPSADVNWGFIELTNDEDEGLFANISYVDFVGLPLGMTLVTANSANQTALGVEVGTVAGLCKDLASQSAADGQDWDQLCMTDSSGTPIRVISPTDYLSINASSFSTYWTEYADQVWSYYNTTPLTIDTQAAAGLVNCTTSNDTMTCAGDNRGYAKPTATDLFGCNGGPFAIIGSDNAVHQAVVPRLCAAFHRSTFLLAGGNVQPSLGSSHYYTKTPTNWYSKFVHDYEIDGKGYAFAYDDVTPDGTENESGLLAGSNPQSLVVTIGGPLSTPSSTTTSKSSKSTTSSKTSSTKAKTTTTTSSKKTSSSSKTVSSTTKAKTTTTTSSKTTSSSSKAVSSTTKAKTTSTSSSKKTSSSSTAASSTTKAKITTTSSISKTSSSSKIASSTTAKTTTTTSSKKTSSSSKAASSTTSLSKTSSSSKVTTSSKSTASSKATSTAKTSSANIVEDAASSSTMESTTSKHTTSSARKVTSTAHTTTSTRKSSSTGHSTSSTHKSSSSTRPISSKSSTTSTRKSSTSTTQKPSSTALKTSPTTQKTSSTKQVTSSAYHTTSKA